MEDFFDKPQNLEMRNISDRESIDAIFYKSVEIILSNF
jgi:hypothetical protein